MNGNDLVWLRDLLDERQRAHEEMHRIEREAIRREQGVSDVKFAKANEVREQIDRERGDFVRRDSLDASMKLVLERISTLERAQSNMDGRLIGAGAIITLISLAISVLSRLL